MENRVVWLVVFEMLILKCGIRRVVVGIVLVVLILVKVVLLMV